RGRAREPCPGPRPPRGAGSKRVAGAAAREARERVKTPDPPAAPRHAAINELLPFIGFVERHPIGSTVEATVDSYSSHGAYVTVDGVRAYVPLRYLGEPPPRSARDVLALGSTAPFVVVSFNAPRRGIDLAMPGFEPPGIVVQPAKKAAKRTRRAAAVEAPPEPARVVAEAAPKETLAKAAKKTTKAKKAAKVTKATKATKATRATKAKQAPAP